jgi:hypothetical protein
MPFPHFLIPLASAGFETIAKFIENKRFSKNGFQFIHCKKELKTWKKQQ